MSAGRPDLDRPRLRAGLALTVRDDGELQVGVGAAARRLHGVGADLLPLLHRMDGTSRLDSLRGLDPRAPELVGVLAAADLLEPRRGPEAGGTVLVVGAG
ncbi:hypothetical protein, partial [Desertihabitans aurantiacus]|uniref:hypothetical protein n=1 Tax=Desertihabitans aurantiacus TaxID=2282477 RepID=UPI0018E52D57